MSPSRIILQIVTALACLPTFLASGQDQAAPGAVATILPEETDELLANPGIGWGRCTLSFNGKSCAALKRAHAALPAA